MARCVWKERDSLVKLPPSWVFTEATTPVARKARKNVKAIKSFFSSQLERRIGKHKIV